MRKNLYAYTSLKASIFVNRREDGDISVIVRSVSGSEAEIVLSLEEANLMGLAICSLHRDVVHPVPNYAEKV